MEVQQVISPSSTSPGLVQRNGIDYIEAPVNEVKTMLGELLDGVVMTIEQFGRAQGLYQSHDLIPNFVQGPYKKTDHLTLVPTGGLYGCLGSRDKQFNIYIAPRIPMLEKHDRDKFLPLPFPITATHKATGQVINGRCGTPAGTTTTIVFQDSKIPYGEYVLNVGS